MSKIEKIKAIVFDLDDTLVAYDVVASSSWKQVCNEYAISNPEIDARNLYNRIKIFSNWYWNDPERHRKGRNNLDETRRQIMKELFLKEAIGPEKKAIQLADRYSKVRTDNMFLFDNAYNVLAYLCDRNFELALVTNGEANIQRAKIKRFKLEKYFKKIFIEGELGYGKPDLRIYNDIVDYFQIPVESICIIGDNLEWEVRLPLKMGFMTIWHDFKKRGITDQAQYKPDYIITKIEEILNIF